MAKRDDLLRLGESETVIGTGVRVKGALISDGDVTIEGKLSGEIKTSGDLTLGVNAVIKANVTGRNVTVSGQLKGNILADGQTTITETGRVIGNIKTTGVQISSGATFVGSVQMAEPLAPGLDEEPEPKPRPKKAR